jgi:hypothetical protein
VPHLDERVLVIGYPMGGDTISVTRGVVSRVTTLNYGDVKACGTRPLLSHTLSLRALSCAAIFACFALTLPSSIPGLPRAVQFQPRHGPQLLAVQVGHRVWTLALPTPLPPPHTRWYIIRFPLLSSLCRSMLPSTAATVAGTPALQGSHAWSTLEVL